LTVPDRSGMTSPIELSEAVPGGGGSGLTQTDFAHGSLVFHYRQLMVPVASLDPFRVTERARLGMCKPCPVYLKCWSCPGLNTGYDAYNERGYEKCLLYLMWVDIDWEAQVGDRYASVLETYGSLASYMTMYGRMLEAQLNGKEMIDGRCAVCRTCTMAESPPRPCAYPDDQRSSLEALGINVIKLSKHFFDHPLQWYREGRSIPSYVSVVHGLLTDAPEPDGMIAAPNVGDEAEEWLARWVSHPAADH
jgi:predicted metal-binding protein